VRTVPVVVVNPFGSRTSPEIAAFANGAMAHGLRRTAPSS
jgi:2-methylcitrate dehydratase PrpD